jgi:hypothetical protein
MLMLAAPVAFDLPPPPPEAVRLVQRIGIAAAFALVEARGGTRIYVPRTASPWLVDLIGAAPAAALAEALGGEFLKVPLARTWRVLAYQARGWSYARIARACGCSEDAVWKILSRAEKTSPQLGLFDE